jgi:hypothetical protein
MSPDVAESVVIDPAVSSFWQELAATVKNRAVAIMVM